MKNIYIAARFSKRPIANALANCLQQRGMTITSRWVKPETNHILPTGLFQQASDSERQRFALEDISDLRNCDTIISLQEEPRNNGRGGRHIEFGYAIALYKKLIVIGPKETVFHHLPEIIWFNTTTDFLAACDKGLL